MRPELMNIKFWDYLRDYQVDKAAILATVESVFESGQLVLGERGKIFENEIATYVGVKHGVGVNSCTDALFLTLKAFGIGPGDEVITVSNTAIPTVSAITAVGATAKFVDVDKESLLMDVSVVKDLISNKTKAIIPVHLYGQMVNMSEVSRVARKYNLMVIEDCAQALGASQDGQNAGAQSNAACFSFYPTKNLGALGDAGMIATNDKILSEKLKRMRFYGISAKYYSVEQGYNSRLDEVQAAILSVKFRRLNEALAKRQKLAQNYDRLLSTVDIQRPKTANKNIHSYHLYVCMHPKRDEIITKMKERGVDLAIHYPHPIHLMEGFAHLNFKKGSLPITEKASAEVFSLPLFTALTESEQEYVSTSLSDVLKTL